MIYVLFYSPAASQLDMLKILLIFPPFIFLHLFKVIMQNTLFLAALANSCLVFSPPVYQKYAMCQMSLY